MRRLINRSYINWFLRRLLRKADQNRGKLADGLAQPFQTCFTTKVGLYFGPTFSQKVVDLAQPFPKVVVSETQLIYPIFLY